MLWRSAIEALDRNRIDPEATGVILGVDDRDRKTNDGPRCGGGADTDGAAAKLSNVSSVPTEQRVTAIARRGLNMPDWENELSFMEVTFYFLVLLSLLHI